MQNKKISPTYIARVVNSEGCFDLQFRKDVKYNRPGTPTYYSWKCQFVINLRKDATELLQQVQRIIGYGTIHFNAEFARYSVQNIENLYNGIVPFFQKNQLHGKKQKDFELWAEAIQILYNNQGKRNIQKGTRGFTNTIWKKKDFQRLIDIQKEMQQYKAKRKQGVKWIVQAQIIAEAL